MGFLKNKFWLVGICSLSILLIAQNSQAACSEELSGVLCGNNKVACRANDGTIKCVTADKCDASTQRCIGTVTTPSTSTPLTPAYLNYDSNNGWLQILGRFEANGLIISGNSELNGAVSIGGPLTISSGAGAGKVLTSDANGLATWQNLPVAVSSGTQPATSETPALLQVLNKGADATAFAGNVLMGTGSKVNLTVGGYSKGTYLVASAGNRTSTVYGDLWVRNSGSTSDKNNNLIVDGKSKLNTIAANSLSLSDAGWIVGDQNVYWKTEVRNLNGIRVPVLSGKINGETAALGRGGILNGTILIGDYGNNNAKLSFTALDNTDNGLSMNYNSSNNSFVVSGDNDALEDFGTDNVRRVNIRTEGSNPNYGVSIWGGDVSLAGGFNGRSQRLVFGELPDINGQNGSGEYIYSNRDTNSQNYWNLVFTAGFKDTMAIANNGNVGIGSVPYSPAERLEVSGGSLLLDNNGSDWGLKIRDSNRKPQLILKVDAGNHTWLNGGDLISFTTNYGDNNVMTLANNGLAVTGGSGKMFFTDVKNTLHLWSPQGSNAGLTIESLFDNRWNINHDRTSTNLSISNSNHTGTSSKDVLTLTKNGMIGINNVFPSAVLDAVTNDSPIANLGGWATGKRAIAMIGGGSSRAIGNYSFASGYSVAAKGEYSVALGGANFGNGTIANGQNSAAIGAAAVANGVNSVALGNGTAANGDSSFAAGHTAIAQGDYSVALGGVGAGITKAEGQAAVAIGADAEVTGYYSIGLGKATAVGDRIFSVFADVNGNDSIGIAGSSGNGGKIQGNNSIGLGTFNIVGNNSVAIGSAIGNGSRITASNSMLFGNGDLSKSGVIVLNSNGGAVGIHNFNPTESLDVKGNINASGSYKVAGESGLTKTITVSGNCTLTVKGGIIVSTTCN